MSSLSLRANANRIPSLDGLRAIAAFCVIVGHASATAPIGESLSKYPPYFGLARFGVNLFFALSGYLITTLLLAEKRSTGSIHTRNFYVRRLFRIVPAFYFYVGCVYVWTTVMGTPIDPQKYAVVLAFMSGVIFPGWLLGHSWSLSIEEQFYAFWPGIVAKLKTRGQLIWCGIGILLPIFLHLAIRYAEKMNYPLSMPWWAPLLIFQGECISWGCLAAVLENAYPGKTEKALLKLGGWAIPIALGLTTLVDVSSSLGQLPYLTVLFGSTIRAVASLLIVLACINLRDGKLRSYLNSRLLTGLGAMSYSIYLWQNFFLLPHDLESAPHYFWHKFPVNLIPIFVLAFLSHRFIELPMLKLRGRFLSVEPGKVIPLRLRKTATKIMDKRRRQG